MNPFYPNPSSSNQADSDQMHSDLSQQIINLEKKIAILNSIFESEQYYIALLDNKCNFLHVNQAYARAQGQSPNWFVGRNHFDLYPDKENEIIFKQVIASGKKKQFWGRPFTHPELGITYWDWSLNPVKNENNQVEQLVLILLDVTEREQVRQKLDENIAIYQALFEQADFGLARLDKKGVIVAANKSLLNLMCCDKNQIYGKLINKFLAEKTLPESEPALSELNLKLYPKANFEISILGDEKKTIWLRVYITPLLRKEIQNENNEQENDLEQKYSVSCHPLDPLKESEKFENEECLGFIVFFYDITDQKNIIKHHEQIFQAQKMQAMGTLASGLAHDFNNSLTTIIVCSDMISHYAKKLNLVKVEDKSNLDIKQKIIANAESIGESCERASNIIDQLRSLGHQSEYERIPMDLKRSIKHLKNICRHSFPKNIQLIFEYNESDHLYIFANPTQIEQALLNILLNALHAVNSKYPSPDYKGRIIMRIGLFSNFDALSLEIPVRFKNEKSLVEDHIMITICDNGVGIPENIRQRIYEPFFSYSRSHEGSGLGLFMAYNTFNRFDGIIDFLTNEKIGTCFYVLLPKKQGCESKISKVFPSHRSIDSNHHVLIIDDDIVMMKSISRALSELGYRITATHDPNEVIEKYKEGTRFDMLIIDQYLRGMTGINLLEEINQICQLHNVLIISGDSEIENEIKNEVENYAFLAKPFSVHDLISKVAEILK